MNAVLVGVDGSDGSRQAAEFASGLARRCGAQLTVIHVIEPLQEGMVSLFGLPSEQLRERQYRYGERMVAELCEELGLGGAEQVIDVGQVPEAICAQAQERDVDLIVVGAHGHGPHRLLPGSVSSRLVKMADRSVTVVRGVGR
ncbi:MAG TPA: universal stress protein [Polyangia bacterium]